MASKTTSKLGRATQDVVSKVAAGLPRSMSWENVRDVIDQRTGSDLDGWELDRATDAAIRIRDRIALPSAA